MLRALVLGTAFLLASAGSALAQLQKVNCQTQGPQLYLDQNNRNDYQSSMDSNGCRYSFYSIGNNGRISLVLEKAVVMKQPENGELRQDGEFSFFYKPKPGFKGGDSFVIYVCGNDRNHAGCARLNYQATIR